MGETLFRILVFMAAWVLCAWLLSLAGLAVFPFA